MDKEEIKDYLKRVYELGGKLTGYDKETYTWLIYGYNQCAKLLNETEQQCKKQKEVIDKAVSILKDNFVYDYVRSCDTTDGIGYDEIDTEHFTYRVYEILNEVSE